MNLVTLTSSHLQTVGGTFNEKDHPPVIWSAASFRFVLKLSLITGSGHAASLHFSGFWFGNTNWYETSCGNQLWPCAFLSFDHLHVSRVALLLILLQQLAISQTQWHKANSQKHWFIVVTFGRRSWAFLKIECVNLSWIFFIKGSVWSIPNYPPSIVTIWMSGVYFERSLSNCNKSKFSFSSSIVSPLNA